MCMPAPLKCCIITLHISCYSHYLRAQNAKNILSYYYYIICVFLLTIINNNYILYVKLKCMTDVNSIHF